jgi:hypothetical protein
MPYIDKRIPNREFPGSSLERIVDQALDEFYGSAALYLTDGVAVGVYEAGVRAAGQVQAFVAALEQVTQSSRAQLQRVHFQLALEAQAATHRAYMAARATGRMSGPYRLSKRDAGGRLERAIASAEFMPRDLRRHRLRQHRRCSTARPASGTGSTSAPARRPGRGRAASRRALGGTVIAALGLEDTPSAPFVLPQGVWTTVGGARAPAGRRGPRLVLPAVASARPGILGRPNRDRITRGIRAWNFLDAGIEFARREPRARLRGLYRDWWESAQRGVGPFSRVDTINIPRLAPAAEPRTCSPLRFFGGSRRSLWGTQAHKGASPRKRNGSCWSAP